MENNKISTQGNRAFIAGVTLVATLGGLLFGYDTAVISGGIGFLQTYFGLSGAGMGWAASSTLVGCVAGALSAGILSRIFGRKLSLMFAALLFAASAFGTAFPEQFTTFVTFRMIGGAGVGIASMLSPMYIAELAPADRRGRLVSFNQFAIVFGILLVYFVNFGIAEKDPLTIPVTVSNEELSILPRSADKNNLITYDDELEKAQITQVKKGLYRLKALKIIPKDDKTVKQYLAQDNAGSYYIAGNMQGDTLIVDSKIIQNKGVNDIFLIKFSPEGNLEWIKTSERSGETPFLSLTVDQAGNLTVEETWNVLKGWRYMFASMAIPALLFFLLLFFVPESPRWLVMKDKSEKALKTLTKVNGATIAGKILDDIKASVSAELEKQNRKIRLGKKWIIVVILIGIMLSVFQQFVGINVVLYYAPEIFKKMGYGTGSSLLQTVLVGTVNVLFTIIAIVTVDKFGRKPLLIIGSIGMAVGMFAIGLNAYLRNLGLGTLIFMMVYVASFAMSWGPIVWVLLSEIFPNRIRGIAMSIAVAAQWGANFLVSQTFPMMNANPTLLDKFHGGFPFWIYAACCIISIVLVWAFVPETKGKTLEEMEKLWIKE